MKRKPVCIAAPFEFLKQPVSIAMLLAFVSLFFPLLTTHSQVSVPRFDFRGRYLVVASDTDMIPSAYTDGKLGPEAGLDQISVIRLDRPPAAMKPATVPVTNSVIGPPSSVVLTPDGRYALVVETQGPRPRGVSNAKLSDLPPGRAITVVDLSNPDHPRVTQQLHSSANPLSVSMNADGTLAAVVFKKMPNVKQPLLALYRLQNGRLSEPFFRRYPAQKPATL